MKTVHEIMYFLINFVDNMTIDELMHKSRKGEAVNAFSAQASIDLLKKMSKPHYWKFEVFELEFFH